MPQIAPIFFVGKKNSKKWIVQDYIYLNEWTIKNNYSLSLILDIVENISTKKVFTKLYLHWDYNNIGEQWIEGSIYNSERIFWINSDVLWPDKLIYDISDNDEQDSIGFDQH